MIQQLTFALSTEERLTRTDFFISPANGLALAAIDAWRNWPNRKMILAGPKGAGKSHLAQIFAADAGAAIIAAKDLADVDLTTLEPPNAIVVEDAETISGNARAEAALFHLHNLLAPSGTLLITATSPPRDWGLTLPDLASRMQSAALTRLPPPDDALLTAVLAKLFADRQLAVPANLIPYLIKRMDRSIATARAMVAGLDERALSQRRPITRALAAELLESLAPE